MGKVEDESVWFVTVLFDVLIAVPLLTLANLYLYVFRARMILGHWPSPGNPSYLVGFGFQAVLVPMGFVASLVSLIAAVVVVSWLLLSRRRTVLGSRPVVARVLLFFVVWVAFFLLFRLDPGQFVAWVWD